MIDQFKREKYIVKLVVVGDGPLGFCETPWFVFKFLLKSPGVLGYHLMNACCYEILKFQRPLIPRDLPRSFVAEYTNHVAVCRN